MVASENRTRNRKRRREDCCVNAHVYLPKELLWETARHAKFPPRAWKHRKDSKPEAISLVHNT